MIRTKAQARRIANQIASPERDPFSSSSSPLRSPSPPPPPPPPPRNEPVIEYRLPASPGPSPQPRNDPPFCEDGNRIQSPPVHEKPVDDTEENGSEESEEGSEEHGSEEGSEEDGLEEDGSEEGARNENENQTAPVNAAPVEPRGVTQPLDFFIRKDQYSIPVKIGTRCYIAETVTKIEKRLDKEELRWFKEHPQFHHFFHMPKDVVNAEVHTRKFIDCWRANWAKSLLELKE